MTDKFNEMVPVTIRIFFPGDMPDAPGKVEKHTLRVRQRGKKFLAWRLGMWVDVTMSEDLKSGVIDVYPVKKLKVK